MAGSLGHKSSSDAVFYASDELFSVAVPFKPPWSFADTPMLHIFCVKNIGGYIMEKTQKMNKMGTEKISRLLLTMEIGRAHV